jgi:hypothetical protein
MGEADMPTRHLSLRLDEVTFQRLDAQSRQTQQSRSHLVKTFVEEGLRMDAHPGIVFRSGPAGRRPGLAGGPDVWEVARIARAENATFEEVVLRVGKSIDLPRAQVEIALRYYTSYPDEIDGWIQRVDEDADRAEATWHRARQMLGR